MNTDTLAPHDDTAAQAAPAEEFTAMDDDDFDTIGDHHRMAAHHFLAAAKHHFAAAKADDAGESDANARHALLAYRHQLSGVQYAEIAAMDNESLDDEFADAAFDDEDGEGEGEEPSENHAEK